MNPAYLHWIDHKNYEEAQLGVPEDGVLFTISKYPTCYRRGRYCLLVEVCSGPNHFLWGCFDDQDQPMRWYHKLENAKDEAEALATVLLMDRMKEIPKDHVV